MPTKRITKKASTRKPAVKRVHKPVVKKAVKEKPEKVEKSAGSLQATVVGLDGKVSGKVSLPRELFGAKENPSLMAQAVRVYLANQRSGNASTKTRGEVEGSTRKIYRQKGTGKARHGSIRAPIFVGGGIVFGPKPRDFRLKLSKSMKRSALASALTTQYAHGSIVFVDGLETLEPKTKIMASTLKNLGVNGKTLLVLSGNTENMKRSARNIKDIDLLPAKDLHAYAVLSHKKLIIMKDAVAELKQTFVRT